MKKRMFYRIFGRVQGVGFRFTAYYAAREAGCTGYVRNEYDGSVTMELQGSDEQIDYVFQKLNESRFIRIEHMDAIRIDIDEKEREFIA
ncbi:MAG: acylphosphatase [Erysipelotrichaceae bacterium]|nr:acylphosphatase [Erysipelotrichaceae bacterium]